MSELEFTPAMDAVIMRYTNVKTPRTIGEMLGIDAKDVIRRVQQMIDETDVLTLQQQKKKLIMDLQQIAQESRIAAEDTIDEYKAGLYNSSVAAQKELMKQLELLEKADNEKITALNQLRIRELLRLLDIVVNSGCAAIAERFGLDEEELLEEFNSRIVVAAEKMELE